MKTILLNIAFLFLAASSFAQLDSVAVSSQFVTNPSITAGLDSISLADPVLQVKVHVNDVDYVGKIVVLVYDSTYNFPLGIMKHERAEILTGALMEDGWIVFNFGYLDPAGSYKIVTETQTFNLAYLEPVTIYYP